MITKLFRLKKSAGKKGGTLIKNFSIIYMSTFGVGFAPPGWQQGHRMKIQKLYYIKSGTGFYLDLHGEKKRFIPGMIYLFPYNYVFEFINSSDDPVNHIFFDFISAPPLIANSPLIYDPSDNPGIKTLLKAFELFYLSEPEYSYKKFNTSHIFNAPKGTDDEKKQIILQMLITIINLLAHYVELPLLNDERICESIEFIRNNYMKPIRVTDIAANAGFEVSYFIKRFKAVMMQTPFAYLRSYRLLQASELLSDGATLAEAAEKSGYADASSLAHAFRTYERNCSR